MLVHIAGFPHAKHLNQKFTLCARQTCWPQLCQAQCEMFTIQYRGLCAESRCPVQVQ